MKHTVKAIKQNIHWKMKELEKIDHNINETYEELNRLNNQKKEIKLILDDLEDGLILLNSKE